MTTVLKIFWRDVKRIVKTPVAIGVVLGMALLPALYAWYCTYANWDPYDNTGTMRIAVANEDEGYSSSALGDLRIGDQMVDTLKENDMLAWQFVSKDDALDGVQSGKYYAAFVIPSSFSEDFASVLTGDAKNPTVEYYVNEKRGSTAVKVADTAAGTIEKQINQTFSDTVAQKVADALKSGAEDSVDTLDQEDADVQAKLANASKLLTQTADALDGASDSIDTWRTTVVSAQVTLGALSQGVPDVSNALEQGSTDLAKLRKESGEFGNSLSTAIVDTGVALGKTSAQVASSASNLAKAADEAQGSVSAATDRIDALIDANNALITQLEGSKTGLPDDAQATIDSTIELLKKQNENLRNTASSLTQVSSDIARATGEASQAIDDLNDDVQQGTKNVQDAGTAYTTQIQPSISSTADSLAGSLSSLSSATQSLTPKIKQLQDLLSNVDSTLKQAQGSLTDASTSIKGTRDHVDSTITDLRGIIQSAELEGLSSMLGLEPTRVGDFMKSPVTLTTEKLYPLEHYGAAVAPFYCNLAIWIGCFMLIAIFKLEVDKEGFENMTATQEYFGRWLLFAIMSAIQALIICVGCVALGMGVENPGLFVLAGLFTSFAFVNIVFCLAMLFRHIGKALAVILLIMQIPGSSGMYPIEVMPPFFQGVHPLLPFTYGINAMREAVGGMHGDAYVENLGILVVFALVALALGLLLRPYLLNLNALFDNRLERTTFMITENQGRMRPRYRVRNVVKALLANEHYHDLLIKRMVGFNRMYPRLVGAGQFLVFLLPLLVIVVSSLFHTHQNAKIILLVVFVLTVVVIDGLMIFTEFMRDNFENQLRMSALKGDELVNDMMDHVPIDHRDFSANHAEKTRENMRDNMRSWRSWRISLDDLAAKAMSEDELDDAARKGHAADDAPGTPSDEGADERGGRS